MKSRYETLVKPYLEEIKYWKEEGLSEVEICENLGVGKTSFNTYKKKYPELLEPLKKSRKKLARNLKNKLVEKAMGFHYEEEKTYIKVSAEGERTTYKEITKKYCVPDTAALAILLKNIDKDENGKSKWSNDPARIDLEKERIELENELRKLKDW